MSRCLVSNQGLISWNYSARRKAAMRELGDMPTALPLGACAASSAAIAGPLPPLPCLERPSRSGACTARSFLCACCCPSSCAHHIYRHTIPAISTRCIASSLHATSSEGTFLCLTELLRESCGSHSAAERCLSTHAQSSHPSRMHHAVWILIATWLRLRRVFASGGSPLRPCVLPGCTVASASDRENSGAGVSRGLLHGSRK